MTNIVRLQNWVDVEYFKLCKVKISTCTKIMQILRCCVNIFTLPDHRNRWSCTSAQRSSCWLVKMGGIHLWLAGAQARQLSCTLCRTPESRTDQVWSDVEHQFQTTRPAQSDWMLHSIVKRHSGFIYACTHIRTYICMHARRYLICNSNGWCWDFGPIG